MSTLLLRLEAPLQAWGSSSRFADRHTDMVPTKSGVVGMVAAALGVPRTDHDTIRWLADATYAVRTDRPGTVIRDYQTAGGDQSGDTARLVLLHNKLRRGEDPAPYKPPKVNGDIGDTHVSNRYYLADAAFVAALTPRPEPGMPTVTQVADALRRPHFPIYLGRRSCPPAEPVLEAVTDESAGDALTRARYRTRNDREHQRLLRSVRDGNPPELAVTSDAYTFEAATYEVADVPVSWAPTDRRYQRRDTVVRFTPLSEEMLSCG